MFDIAWSELLIIAIIALIVIGPKELPEVMRSLARGINKLRRNADDFRRQFDESMRDTGYQDIQRDLHELRQFNPVNQIRNELDRALNSEPDPNALPPPAATPAAGTLPAPHTQPVAAESTAPSTQASVQASVSGETEAGAPAAGHLSPPSHLVAAEVQSQVPGVDVAGEPPAQSHADTEVNAAESEPGAPPQPKVFEPARH